MIIDIKHFNCMFFRVIRSCRIFLLLLSTIILLFLSSCNKQLDISSSRLSSETNTWNSYDGVGAALTGIYGLLRAAMADNNTYWMFGELRSGDFVSYNRSDLASIINGKLNVSYPLLQELLDWRRFYAVIDACNLFIEKSSTALSDARYTEKTNQVDIAQVRAIRAFVYFYMSRIWGDVPLITESRPATEYTNQPRTSQDKVLSFATSELTNAVRDLPFVYGLSNDDIFPGTYYGKSYTSYYNTLVNRVFAYATLAHIAAWQGKYNDVQLYTNYILLNYSKIGASLITDITNLTDADGLFDGKLSTRQFFSLVMDATNSETGISGMGHLESLTLGSPLVAKQYPDIYVTKDSLLSMFTDPNDDRFTLDTSSGSYSTDYIYNYNTSIPIFSKIKVIGDPTGTTTNLDVFSSSIVLDRLEEIYLLRAEAFAALNQPSEAINLLNVIKGNRGVASYAGSGGQPLIDEIFAERRRELIGEAWRWYDLVRYNRLSRSNTSFNKLIDSGGVYWPVANSVMENNPLITQNPYW